MLELTPKQAMLVFGELVQCYFNNNAYGGDTAEIYAYRLARMTATVATALCQIEPDGIYVTALKDFADEAAENLLAICKLFASAYDVNVMVDGKPITEGIDPFSHRVHITVAKRET